MVGVLEVGQGIEVLAEMIIVQRLTHPGNVDVRDRPHPGGAIAQHLPERETLPARLAHDRFEILGGAINEPLGPRQAEGHARALRQEINLQQQADAKAVVSIVDTVSKVSEQGPALA
jgi:hypothetical protein